MLNHEWPLVFFTILSQLSAGMIIALMAFSFLKQYHEEKKAETFFKSVLYMAFVFMVIALALSFLHLKQPMRSVYALSNIKSSWLSLEILTATVFLFFMALAILFYQLKRPQVYMKIIMMIAAAAGIVFVYAMASIYMIPTVPAWNTPKTITGFYSTALLIGPALALAIYLKHFKMQVGALAINKYSVILSGMIIIALFLKVINTLFISPAMPLYQAGFKPEQIPDIFPVLQWLFLLTGVVLFVVAILKKSNRLVDVILWFVFGFFLVSEFIDRVIFYASYFRIGL